MYAAEGFQESPLVGVAFPVLFFAVTFLLSGAQCSVLLTAWKLVGQIFRVLLLASSRANSLSRVPRGCCIPRSVRSGAMRSSKQANRSTSGVSFLRLRGIMVASSNPRRGEEDAERS